MCTEAETDVAFVPALEFLTLGWAHTYSTLHELALHFDLTFLTPPIWLSIIPLLASHGYKFILHQINQRLLYAILI